MVFYVGSFKRISAKRVEAGELSESEAKKEERKFSLCSYGVLVIGACLLLTQLLTS